MAEKKFKEKKGSKEEGEKAKKVQKVINRISC